MSIGLKRYCFIILLMLTFAQAYSQSNKFDFTIEVGCGFIGKTSAEFNYYATLIKDKKFDAIKEGLKSTGLLMQLLSAISLDELNRQGKVALTDAEREMINSIKKSKKKYYLCNGCTNHSYGNVSQIFNHNQNDENLLNLLRLFNDKVGL